MSALHATYTSGAKLNRITVHSLLKADFTHSHATRHIRQQQYNYILYLCRYWQFMKSFHRHLSPRTMCKMGRAGVIVL